MKLFLKIIALVLAVAYPFVVLFFTNQGIQPRYLSLILIILLIAQLSKNKNMGRGMFVLAGLWLILITVLIVGNDERILRLYPVAVNLALLGVFGLSIKYPPTVVEKLARLQDKDLHPTAVLSCVVVTKVWCAFFIFNITASKISCFLPMTIWALYNGFISYIIMGLLFAVEYIVRINYKKVIAREAASPDSQK